MRNLKMVLIFSAVIFLAGLIYFYFQKSGPKPEFQSQINEQGGITFTVKLLNLNDKTEFEVSIGTHSGSLDFDLTKISILEDDKGGQYQPIDWQGAGPGGHHVSGILIFPKLNKGIKSIKLTIQDSLPRIFEWKIK